MAKLIGCKQCGKTILEIDGNKIIIPCDRCSKNTGEEKDIIIDMSLLTDDGKTIKL